VHARITSGLPFGNARAACRALADPPLHLVSSQRGSTRDETGCFRPVANNAAQKKTRDVILQGYAEYEEDVVHTS